MKITKCDICGKEVGFSALVTIVLQGGYGFENVSEYREYIGEKDICLNCLKKIFERYKNDV